MKLEEGMCVIDNKRLNIGQIKYFCTCAMCEERGFYEPIIDNPNIIITDYDKDNGFHGYKFYDDLTDLIEVGDYVNGKQVKQSSYGREPLVVECNNGYHDIKCEDIKSIVTKEQFKQMEYKVGE